MMTEDSEKEMDVKILGTKIGTSSNGWDILDTMIFQFYNVKVDPKWLNHFSSNVRWELTGYTRFDLQLDYDNGLLEIFKPDSEHSITTIKLDLLKAVGGHAIS